MNTTARSSARAISNSALTSLSDSPWYLDTKSDEEIAKNVDLHSAAKAFAIYVLPVPGTPYRRIARHGYLSPENNCGMSFGRITASYNAYLALSKPATSLKVISGMIFTMHYFIASFKALFSSSGLAFGLPPPTAGTAYLGAFKSSICLIYCMTLPFNISARDGSLSYFNQLKSKSQPYL